MELIRPLLAAVAVLALMGATLWLLRRRNLVGSRPASALNSDRRMRLMERLRLSPHHTLNLVALGDRTVLILTHPGGGALLECRSDGGEGVR